MKVPPIAALARSPKGVPLGVIRWVPVADRDGPTIGADEPFQYPGTRQEPSNEGGQANSATGQARGQRGNG